MIVSHDAEDPRRPWGLRRAIYTGHLWLGLASGLVVFVVGLTGALYVFEPELKALYAGPSHVAATAGAPLMPVSALLERGHAALTQTVAGLAPPTNRWILLHTAPGRVAVYSAYWDLSQVWYEVTLDPYRGEALAVRNHHWDPLNVVLRLHRSLLLPEEIGRWIVGVAVLISVGMLASGLVLWFPRRPSDLAEPGALRQRLTIRIRGRLARVNYDLHRVLGFYGLAVALVIALTGLVWSFSWFDRAVYWVVTGGGTPVELPPTRSGPAGAPPPGALRPADRALAEARREFPGAARYEVIVPAAADGPLQVCANPDERAFYRIDCGWFDRHTGAPLRADRYRDKNAGELVRAMNYDVHVGQILGWPGRILACGASLIVASLPITGTLLWLRRGGGPRARRRLRAGHRRTLNRSRQETLMSAPFRSLLVTLSLVALFVSSAHAQTPSPPREPGAPPVELPELRVPGILDQGYVTRDATTGTKTDTPLIETPATVTVIPRKQLDDQRLLTLTEALSWVPGFADESSRGSFDRFTLRGFFAADSTFLDGLRTDPRFWVNQEVFGLERIEVLKGPASVLYGQVEPGGIVNLVSKRPRPEAHYELGFSAGSFNLYEGTVDVGGPVTKDKSVLFRFSGLYRNRDDVIDFIDNERIYLAPALTVRLGSDTTLTLLANYIHDDFVEPIGVPAEGTVLRNPNGKIPISRFVGEPRFNRDVAFRLQGGYQLEHRFTENLRLRNNFRVQSFEFDDDNVRPDVLDADQRTVIRFASGNRVRATNVGMDTHLEWTVRTGPVSHRVLGGVDYFWDRFADRFYFTPNVAPLDVFNPVYGSPVAVTRADFNFDAVFNSYQTGVYVQDQMKIFDVVTLLLGARFDDAQNTSTDRLFDGSSYQHDRAATWRAALLYQFLPGLAAYLSYATSYLPTTFGTTADGSPLKPEHGEQYEVGLKADLLNGRLTSVLAFYDLTRENVITTDPVNPFFSVQTGEQRSRGVEWDGRARILPGWELLAFYSYIDGEITRDNTFPRGNKLPAVPKHSGGLWTTWTFQSGLLKGLGFGLAGRYVGERMIDLANSLELPDYAVLDASVFYGWGPLRAQVNFKNLTDKEYFTGNGRFVIPGDPFTVLGQLTWNFR
jgi:iron complex outermembrane recepter protein